MVSECCCKPCTDHARKWAEALEVAAEIAEPPDWRQEKLRRAFEARMASLKADEAAFGRAVEKVSNAAPHTERDPFVDVCVTCWSRIPPRRATLVTDDVPRTATTTGGV